MFVVFAALDISVSLFSFFFFFPIHLLLAGLIPFHTPCSADITSTARVTIIAFVVNNTQSEYCTYTLLFQKRCYGTHNTAHTMRFWVGCTRTREGPYFKDVFVRLFMTPPAFFPLFVLFRQKTRKVDVQTLVSRLLLLLFMYGSSTEKCVTVNGGEL